MRMLVKLMSGNLILIMSISLLVGCNITNSSSEVEITKEQPSIQPGTQLRTQPMGKDNSGQNSKMELETVDTEKIQNIFGFSDKSGKYLIVCKNYKSISVPSEIDTAIGDNGKVINVKYLKVQNSNEKNNNRETSNNFDNLEGYVYEVVEGNAISNNSYFLTSKKFFNTKALVKMKKVNNIRTDEKTISRIEVNKNRKVMQCWTISELETDKYICVVEFERQGEDLLTCVAYVTSEKIIFKNYSLKFNSNAESALSKGDITPNMFKVLFAANTNDVMILSVSRLDYETIDTNLLVNKNGEFFEIGIGDIRYTAPT